MFTRMERFPEPTALFEAVKKALGLPDDAKQWQIAEALGRKLGHRVDPSRVSRWQSGGGFHYENAMSLLHIAGWLNEPAVRAAKRDADRRARLQAAKEAEDLAGREELARDKRRREPGA